MKRSAHTKLDRASSADLLHGPNDAIHSSHLARHDRLVGSVVVGGFHDSGPTSCSKNTLQIVVVQSYDGRHRARRSRRSSCHDLSTSSHESNAILKREDAGTTQRAELPQAVTSSNIAAHTSARKCLDPCHLGRKEGRLSVLGASQCRIVTCLDEIPKVKTKHVACLSKQSVSHNRVDHLAGHSLSLIHISEPTRLGMISYAVFCLKK